MSVFNVGFVIFPDATRFHWTATGFGAIAAVGDAIDEILRPLLTLDGDRLRDDRRRKFLAIDGSAAG